MPPFAAGDRVDGFLARHGGHEERSRAEWQRLIGLDVVLVNGRPAKPSQRVNAGDVLYVAEVAWASTLEPEESVPFQVVYEDPSMVIIDKPAGVVVHPAPGNESGTLVHGLLARYPALQMAVGDARPGIVHRLDKNTSGLLVVGLTLSATADLQRQMQARTTEKRYLALVVGNVAEDEGSIEAPIARHPKQRQRMAVRSGGRQAITRFTVRERFGDYTLLDVQLLTGRTHQIRVHCAFIGRPVAGDSTYGSARAPGGLKRQFLHAYSLRLRSPHDGEEHTFEAPLPDDLESALSWRRRRGSRAA